MVASESSFAWPPSRWALRLIVLALVLAGIGAYQFIRSNTRSDGDNLTALFESRGDYATCSKVGALAFAGGRSSLYACSWSNPTTFAEVTKCAVWSDGSGYDVTKEARSVFRLQGETPPC